jgi:hypothetical protein
MMGERAQVNGPIESLLDMQEAALSLTVLLQKHMTARGFPDIGFNFAIQAADGSVRVGDLNDGAFSMPGGIERAVNTISNQLRMLGGLRYSVYTPIKALEGRSGSDVLVASFSEGQAIGLVFAPEDLTGTQRPTPRMTIVPNGWFCGLLDRSSWFDKASMDAELLRSAGVEGVRCVELLLDQLKIGDGGDESWSMVMHGAWRDQEKGFHMIQVDWRGTNMRIMEKLVMLGSMGVAANATSVAVAMGMSNEDASKIMPSHEASQAWEVAAYSRNSGAPLVSYWRSFSNNGNDASLAVMGQSKTKKGWVECGAGESHAVAVCVASSYPHGGVSERDAEEGFAVAEQKLKHYKAIFKRVG